jgi:prepilin-type N-terminal cleavage/methylation domain-containing protein
MKHSQNGFTILELLVASVIGLTFGLAGWSFQRTQALELGRQSATIDATEDLRAAMGFLAAEIRQAGFDPRQSALLVTGSRGISEARGDSLLIQVDANRDGDIDLAATDADPDGAESILYSYDATTREIIRTVADVSQVLFGNVPAGGFALSYFDVLGNPLAPTGNPAALDAAQRDLVAFVRLDLRVNAVGVAPTTTFRTASRLTLRNRVLDRL